MRGRARRVRAAMLAALLGCSMMPALASAQAPRVDRHPARPVSADRVYQLLATLSADSMEGRQTGEPGELRAARVIAAEMRAAGLEAGGDSSFLQRVPMAIVTQVTVRDGQEFRRERLTLMPDFAALDTIPPEKHRPSVNVVGILRGTDPSVANEHILVGAHHDHVGIGRAVGGDSIYNGADDDASGVVAVLEVARALADGPRPRRTIVFATTTGEESGLLGTRWYIDNPVLPMDQMVADLQIEMIGRPDSLAGGPGRAWLTGYERSTMGDVLAANDIPIVADPRPEQNFFMRSDNIAFARLGIPAHTLSSFVDHAEYHSPDDEVELTDRQHMASIIDATIQAVWQLANGPRPEWHPGMRPCAQGEQPQEGVCRN